MKPVTVRRLIAYDQAVWFWRNLATQTWPRPKPRWFGKSSVSVSLYSRVESRIDWPYLFEIRARDATSSKVKKTEPLRCLAEMTESFLVYAENGASTKSNEARAFADVVALSLDLVEAVNAYAPQNQNRDFTVEYARAMQDLQYLSFYQEGYKELKLSSRLSYLDGMIPYQQRLNETLAEYGSDSVPFRFAVSATEVAVALVHGKRDFIYLTDQEKNEIKELESEALRILDGKYGAGLTTDECLLFAALKLLNFGTHLYTGTGTIEYLVRNLPENWGQLAERCLERVEELPAGRKKLWIYDRLG